tara:strand:+ start:6384 stop:7346 length:963 start_codon:yes stop_codon:yes gene_type:complete
MKIKPIIIVAGEPYSIFLEIFFKSIKKYKCKRPILLIASKKLILLHMKKFQINLKINFLVEENIYKRNFVCSKINIINVDLKENKSSRLFSKKTNSYINNCFAIGLRLIKKKIGDKLINGPISKKNFLNGKFLGVTEYLGDKANAKDVAMLIYNEDLSVSPVTTHLPLKNVHQNLSKKKIINQIRLINDFYKINFNKKPKIAVTGLNPHCESNFLTSEEDLIIEPAIKYMANKNYKVSGPFAADTIFMKSNYKKFDVIIGMYHDQVLTPMKTLYEFNAINITLGLPYIRVSPDHGPNFSMVGKNQSNPESLIKAFKFLDK